MKDLKKPGKNLMKPPETYVKKIQSKDSGHNQSVIDNIRTIASIKHPLIPKIIAVDETHYEMEYIHGRTVASIYWNIEEEKRKELIFNFVSQVSTLINVMFKLKNNSYPDHLFIGKDMRTLSNYMIDNTGRMVCLDFDSWRWYPDKEAIWHARNAISFQIERLIIF